MIIIDNLDRSFEIEINQDFDFYYRDEKLGIEIYKTWDELPEELKEAAKDCDTNMINLIERFKLFRNVLTEISQLTT